MKYFFLLIVCFLVTVFFACSRSAANTAKTPLVQPGDGAASATPEAVPALPDLADAIQRLNAGNGIETNFPAALSLALEKAEIPPQMAMHVLQSSAESPAFILDLMTCLAGDFSLRQLVDKQHALPNKYEPSDLVKLSGGSYEVSRGDLMLRKQAASALEEMAAAAKKDGVTLTASSSYRSYDYQVTVYNRNVNEMGQEAADRESARPGFSQHQTGLVVDFGSIDDSFARTAAGRWILANGPDYGWTISFPDGYETVTGYRWESWHYRYVGKDLAVFINTWFGGIQQFALRFLYEWEQIEQLAGQ
jgi:D-alanyl-D-alanine carboxypeptidase